jgi:hypothetical protein
VIRGCLSLPFRLASVALLILLAYVGWENRDALRRWVHRMTADPVRGSENDLPAGDLRRRARIRLDSLAAGRADSVILTVGEVEALVAGEAGDRTAGLVDSVRVEVRDGELGVRGVVDAARLPPGSLGPLEGSLGGRQAVEGRGPLTFRRLGAVEWRITAVAVRGVPLPRALWARLLPLIIPVQDGTIDLAVPAWLTGLRVVESGIVLYGGAGR